MKKELDYFYVGNNYGWNQNMFSNFFMRMGGCACVTACDSMIYLKKYKNKSILYNKQTDNINEKDYLEFSNTMKKYLYPRISGVNRLDIYTKDLKKYLSSISCNYLNLKEVWGDTQIDIAKKMLINQIDNEIPLPFLMLLSEHKEFKNYEWHWFIINGYENNGSKLIVKAVTYGSYRWIDFDKLWDNKYNSKGGFIVFEGI